MKKSCASSWLFTNIAHQMFVQLLNEKKNAKQLLDRTCSRIVKE